MLMLGLEGLTTPHSISRRPGKKSQSQMTWLTDQTILS